MCVQVEKSAADADRALTDAEITHKRAADLDSEVEKLRKKIQGEGNHLVVFHCFGCFLITRLRAFGCVFIDLLQKLKESGTTVPSDDSEKLFRDAERMVKEMEKRNFTPQKTAAQKENDEAKKRKTPSEFGL